MADNRPAPQKTYSWTYKDGKVNCFASPDSKCNVSKLWEVTQTTGFHDAELVQATKEINSILANVRRENRDPTRELSFILVKGRHFLVWTTPGRTGPHDSDETIKKMLRIKTT